MTKGQLQAMIVRWLLIPWERLRELKVVHACFAAAYTAVMVAGVGLWIWAPWMGGWSAGLLVLGGGLPLASLHGGHWGLERAGLIFLWSGLLVYAASVPGSHDTITLGETVARAALVGAFAAVLGARWFHIRELDLDPDR